MLYRQLGTTDMHVPVITFGAWAAGGWMWGGQDDRDALDAMSAAFDLGVNAIDTAAIYGFGHSETLVGRFAKGKRDKLLLFTKFGLRWDCTDGVLRWDTHDNEGNPRQVFRNGRKKSIILECERSLDRLGTDYIDLYQQHWPDPTTPIAETMEAMDILLRQGKIRAAGVSNYTLRQLEEACRSVPIASSQPPYSMILRDIEADLLPWCVAHNIATICYSPLQRGLLTGKVTADRQFAPGDHRADNPLFRRENRRRVLAFLDELRPIAEAHRATLAQLVLAWTIRRPGITAALVGARDARQARENAQAADVQLTEEQMQRINESVDRLAVER